MPVANATSGATHKVGPYFENLRRIKEARGEATWLEHLADIPVAVHTDRIVSGVDNAFNNLESAIGPLRRARYPLRALDTLVQLELAEVQAALAMENATIVNFAEHPSVAITEEFYLSMRSPKPVYDYWVGYRGWNHMAGVDAKAHNGPTTGVTPADAARALNVVLAASPALIALYANSPFEAAQLTGNKENRLTIWPRMFSTSRFACDRWLHGMPDVPFRDLGHYFSWMFGPGTNMQFLVDAARGDYKKSGRIIVVASDPPFLDFLAAQKANAVVLKTGEQLQIQPDMRHFEFLQFSHFLDARIRFGLREECSTEEFLAALKRPEGVEELFARILGFCYIEGRTAGANFPDKELAGLDNAEVPRSVVISPAALQAGLLQNLDAAWRHLGHYAWSDLVGLRAAAIEHGLDARYNGLDASVLARSVLELAQDGLTPDLHWMLAYPTYVLATGQNGADRALAAFDRSTGALHLRLAKLVRERAIQTE